MGEELLIQYLVINGYNYILQITNIDVSAHLKKNRLAHHTDEYDSKDLILRRGQVFEFNVTFDRSYNKDTDKIFLEFDTGKYEY